MNSLVKNNLSLVQKILKHYNVQSAYLFGSATSLQFNDNSDIDILFSFKDDLDYETYSNNYFAIITELEKLLNRQVDLIAEKTLSNKYLIEKINSQKIQIV